jgi:hypothetical protein
MWEEEVVSKGTEMVVGYKEGQCKEGEALFLGDHQWL